MPALVSHPSVPHKLDLDLPGLTTSSITLEQRKSFSINFSVKKSQGTTLVGPDWGPCPPMWLGAQGPVIPYCTMHCILCSSESTLEPYSWSERRFGFQRKGLCISQKKGRCKHTRLVTLSHCLIEVKEEGLPTGLARSLAALATDQSGGASSHRSPTGPKHSKITGER